MTRLALLTLSLWALLSVSAMAQGTQTTLDIQGVSLTTTSMSLIAMLTILSVAPAILMMTTSYRIATVSSKYVDDRFGIIPHVVCDGACFYGLMARWIRALYARKD